MFFTIRELANRLNGKVIGNDNDIITGVASLENGKSGDIVFAQIEEIEKIKKTKASCVLVKEHINEFPISQIIVEDPYLAFIYILKIVEETLRSKPEMGIHSTALVGKNVSLGNDVAIGAFVFIGDNTIIEDKAIIYPSVFIGNNVKIGKEALIYSNVSIRENVDIGNKVIIHCGSVIGCDGYGYRQKNGKHIKIPQVGKVIIGNDVEIGANTVIDRATLDATYIGNGTKIDNLVHIAHNTEIGENVLIVAQVGIAGSSKIGNYAVLGGQVGVKDHVTVGEGVQIGAQAGVIGNIPAGAVIWGTPARSKKEVLKSEAYIAKLPEMTKKIKEIEEEIKKMKHPCQQAGTKENENPPISPFEKGGLKGDLQVKNEGKNNS